MTDGNVDTLSVSLRLSRSVVEHVLDRNSLTIYMGTPSRKWLEVELFSVP